MQAPLAAGTPGEQEAEGGTPAAAAVALGGPCPSRGAAPGTRSPGTGSSPRGNNRERPRVSLVSQCAGTAALARRAA